MKKIFWFLFIAVLSFSLYSVTGTCHNGICFDCYDSLQNLPQNQIVAFAGAPSGHMFVATKNSLVRFDGSEFVLPDGGKLAGIPTSTINDFVSDGIGNGYIATDLGVWITDLGSFRALKFKNAEKVGNFNVKSLAYDKKKALLYGAVNGKGVFVLSVNGFFEWFSPENSRLGTKNVNKVFIDSSDTVWLGTENGVYFMKDGSERFVQVDYLDDSISAFAEGADNIIYAGGKNCFYTIENNEVSIGCENKEKALPYADITVLEANDSGWLWIGTKNGGLFPDENHSLDLGGAITASARDKEGNVWFGTSTGGFCIAKRSSFKGMIFDEETVSGIVSDSAGNIFVNTRKGIFKENDEFGPWESACGETGCKQVFNRIFFDKTDNLWVSGESGLYIMQPDKTFKPVKEIYTSAEDLFPVSTDVFFSDSEGNVWVSDNSLVGALFVFKNDRTVEKYQLPDVNAEIVDIIDHEGQLFVVTKWSGVFGLEENGTLKPVPLWKKDVFVKRTFVDSKQRIWVVTLSNEIFVDIENDAIAFHVPGISGEAAIHSVLEDKNGNFWLMTNIGVASIKGKDADCFLNGGCSSVPAVVYGKKNGMASWECAEGRTSDSALSDNRLYVPMMKGIAVFDTNFKEKDDFVPEIVIENIFSSDDGGGNYSLDDIGKMSLPQTVENLSISYSAPLFSGAGELFFDYSFDKEQVNRTSKRTVNLSNIHGGSHEFSVRAYRSGNPSKFTEKKFVFEVDTEWHEKKWLVVTAPFILVAFIVFMIFLNRRLKKIREYDIKRLIDEKTAELQIKNNALKEAVMKDPLTGLMNRRYMFDVEERKIRRFIESRDRKMHLLDNRNIIQEKNDNVYGVIMMDIDHFKRVNDLYGHDVGDMVLKGVAEVMQESVRADDILIRWGGEEFLIVLKNIPLEKMFEVAKKIRKAIEKHPFTTQGGSTVWITVSMGIVALPFFVSEPKLVTFENVVTLADTALYHSKENGRDMATFVVPGQNVPATQEDVGNMLSSSEFAAVNGFYTFEKIEPDNFSEFEM
jgi:diguanylate cyclase (GGDEF) domain